MLVLSLTRSATECVLLLRLSADMWAMGAIMAELFTLRPLFPGAR